MFIEKIHPVYPLSDYIEMYWYWKGNASELPIQQQFITPDTHTNLVLNFGSEMKYFNSSGMALSIKDAVYIGQQSKAYMGSMGEIIDLITIRFKPHGAASFMNLPVIETSEQIINPNYIFGNVIDSLKAQIYEQQLVADKIRILENGLLALLHKHVIADKYIDLMINKIKYKEGIVSLKDISSQSGSEYKRMQRSFNACVGISPKLFSRMLRFDGICKKVVNSGKTDWFDIIAAYELADQSHLIKEFQFFTGYSPTEFAARIQNKEIAWV
jgi:AraC-like DNA-binding protein